MRISRTRTGANADGSDRFPVTGSIAQENSGGTNVAVTGNNTTVNINPTQPIHPFLEIVDRCDTSEPLHGEATNLLQWFQESSCVKIVGNPGVGKSTLARYIGSHSNFTGVYCWDLTKFEAAQLGPGDVNEILRAITHLSGEANLLIIENVHADPGIEQAVVEHVRLNRLKGSILFTTRHSVTNIPGVPVFELQVTASRLGTLLKHISDRDGLGIPEPPQDILQTWVEKFPDLVSFENAVKYQAGKLAQQRWDLAQRHAVQQVDSTYLRGRSSEMKRTLLLIAAAGVWECPVAHQTVTREIASQLHREGLLLQDETHYFLSHPMIAKLLLRASFITDCRALYAELAAGDPVAICKISIAMERAGDGRSSRSALAQLVGEGGGVKFHVIQEQPLLSLAKIISALIKRQLVTGIGIDQQLADQDQLILRKLADCAPHEILFSVGQLRSAWGTYLLVAKYLNRPSIIEDLEEWARKVEVSRLAWSASELAKLKITPLAEKIISILVLERLDDMNTLLLQGTTKSIAFLKIPIKDVGQKAALCDYAGESLRNNMPAVVARLLQRSIDEYLSYPGVLQGAVPDVIAPFYACLGEPAIQVSMLDALSRAGFASLLRSAVMVNEGKEYSATCFGEMIAEELSSRLRSDSIEADLLALPPDALKQLFKLRSRNHVNRPFDALGDQLIEKTRDVLVDNMYTLVTRLLDQGIGYYFSFGDALEDTLPELRGLLSACLVDNTEVLDMARAVISNASLSSLIQAGRAVGERSGYIFPAAFFDYVRAGIESYLSSEVIADSLLELSHVDLANLFELGYGVLALDEKLNSAIGALIGRPHDLARRHLNEGLFAFVHVGEVCERQSRELKGKFLSSLGDADVRGRLGELIPKANRRVCTRLHLLIGKLGDGDFREIAKKLNANRLTMPIRVADGRNKFVISSVCNRADRTFLDANGAREPVEDVLRSCDTRIPAIAGRLIGLVATSAVDLDVYEDLLARLTDNDQYFAFVGAWQMVGQLPVKEDEMWSNLIRRYRNEWSVLRASGCRLLAVSRGIDPGTGFAARYKSRVKSWYGEQPPEPMTWRVQAVLHSYGHDRSSVTREPPLYPYQVLSYAAVMEEMGGLDPALKAELVAALAERYWAMSPNDARRFKQWADFSELARRAIEPSGLV